MNSKERVFNREDLEMLLRIKSKELNKQNVHNITYEQLNDYLFNWKWTKKESVPLYEVVDDIMNIEVSDLFEYLSLKGIKEASSLTISDFSELIYK